MNSCRSNSSRCSSSPQITIRFEALSNAVEEISYKILNDKNYETLKITEISFFVSFQSASPRWEPQISILCEAGQQYLPQYLSEDGRWSSELSVKVPGVSCLRDKMDLLDYCKKVSFIVMEIS